MLSWQILLTKAVRKGKWWWREEVNKESDHPGPGSRLQAPGGHRPELSYDQASLGAKPQQQVAPPQRPQQQQHLQQWATAGARNVKCGGKQFTYLQSFIDRKEEERRLADLMWGPATSSAAGPCHVCHITCVTCNMCHVSR